MLLRLSLIFLAGGCGCLLRYGLVSLVHRWSASTFPIGTVVVNVLGCAAVGFLAALFSGQLAIREEYRLAILVGLLGGFTTFSAFSLETVKLAGSGQFGLAVLNVVASNALGLTAAWLGMRLAPGVEG